MLTSGTMGETLSPNECHSTPLSVIRGIYPHTYKYVYARIPSESSMMFRQHRPASAEQAPTRGGPPSSLFRKITKEYSIVRSDQLVG